MKVPVQMGGLSKSGAERWAANTSGRNGALRMSLTEKGFGVRIGRRIM